MFVSSWKCTSHNSRTFCTFLLLEGSRIESNSSRLRDMDTREITIRVDAEAAKAYAVVSTEEREKIDILLSLRLSQVTGPSASLEQVMQEISEAARERGLTEERLSEMLREE